jgi:hypothetical protein
MTQTDNFIQLSQIADAVEAATGERLDIDDVEEMSRLQDIAFDLAASPNIERNKLILSELSRITFGDDEVSAWPHGGAPLQYRDDISHIGLDDPMLDDLNETWHTLDSRAVSSTADSMHTSPPKLRVIEGYKEINPVVLHAPSTQRPILQVHWKPLYSKITLDQVLVRAGTQTFFAPDTVDSEFSGEEFDKDLNIRAWTEALTAAERCLNSYKKNRLFQLFNFFKFQHPRYEITNLGNNSKELIAISGSLRTSMRYVVSGSDVYIKINKSDQSHGTYSAKEKITLRDTPSLGYWLAEQFEDDPEIGSGLVHSLNTQLLTQNN